MCDVRPYVCGINEFFNESSIRRGIAEKISRVELTHLEKLIGVETRAHPNIPDSLRRSNVCLYWSLLPQNQGNMSNHLF